ncbi:RsmD family RNA methyltransferase, partial [Rhodococcus rhodnii]
EALFSAIDSRLDLDGAAVLDLYAGSGALGLEALSRGAGEVLLVESDATAARVITQNVAALGLPGGEVRRASVATVLAVDAPREYDLVLLDPPYALDTDAVESDLERLLAGGWVGEGSLVVVERSARSPLTHWPDGYEPAKPRTYGDTRIELAVLIRSRP